MLKEKIDFSKLKHRCDECFEPATMYDSYTTLYWCREHQPEETMYNDVYFEYAESAVERHKRIIRKIKESPTGITCELEKEYQMNMDTLRLFFDIGE